MSVFAVHPVGEKDLTGAKIYGEIIYINRRYVYSDELVNDTIPNDVYSKYELAVDRFDPEHDYVLIAGDHLQLILFSALLGARWNYFKVLRYDREAGGYVAVTIHAPVDNEPQVFTIGDERT